MKMSGALLMQTARKKKAEDSAPAEGLRAQLKVSAILAYLEVLKQSLAASDDDAERMPLQHEIAILHLELAVIDAEQAKDWGRGNKLHRQLRKMEDRWAEVLFC